MGRLAPTGAPCGNLGDAKKLGMSADTNRSCGQPHCYPEDTGCKMGERPDECSHFKRGVKEEAEKSVALPAGEGVPWTGSEFGLDDIAWLASRQRPLLYAPIGAHNAGKTTFLASLYIGLCRGVLPAKHQFVGSFTLGGWEKLAAYVRYAPDGIGPAFPPHTPVTENRVPGWLHIGFRTGDGRVRDILFADSPGEWFSRWAVHAESEGAVGARWVARHADGFLFFVDSDGLAGPDRRNVVEKTELLAERLSGVMAGRPVGIIWAKSDKEIRPQIRDDVEAALDKALPNAVSFLTSVHSAPNDTEPTRPFWNPIEWLLLRDSPAYPLPVPEPLDATDPFLAFRG